MEKIKPKKIKASILGENEILVTVEMFDGAELRFTTDALEMYASGGKTPKDYVEIAVADSYSGTGKPAVLN